MNAPVQAIPGPTDQPNPFFSLETIELQMALQSQSILEHGFAGSVRRALEAAGGELLFELRTDDLSESQRVAAVVVGEGEERQHIVVSMPRNGGTPKIERAEDSTNPVAGIVSAYAAVLDRLSRPN